VNVYLAARYSRRKEILGYAEQLKKIGVAITSRWIEGSHQISDDQLGLIDKQLHESEEAAQLGQRFAIEDVTDIANADLFIGFTEEPRTVSSRGGRHVELGLALGNGLECWIVGPRENVFHCLPEVRCFSDWPEALQEIADRRRQP